ncbi:hypothetical protein TNCV_4730291 [Trichonephila clavipes]|nr:hypothetical protein TNCV_4730291 [Trichonephila clavipes]
MASLGHQSLPPTDLGRVDEEMASPGAQRPLLNAATPGDAGKLHKRRFLEPCHGTSHSFVLFLHLAHPPPNDYHHQYFH